MRATMYGWEMVCPDPIGSAASAYARCRSSGGTKSSRGTRSIACRTRSSTTSRARSCSSTMARRSGSKSDTKVRQHERREVDDAPRLALDPGEQHRHLGVARNQRAVAATAGMVVTTQIGELVAGSCRDEDVAGVGVAERSVQPTVCVGIRAVQLRELLSLFPDNDAIAVAVG